HKPQRVLSPPEQTLPAAEAKVPTLLHWVLVAVLFLGVVWGISAGIKSIVRSLESRQTPATTAVTRQATASPLASTATTLRTQVIIVEGSAVLASPASSEFVAPARLIRGRLAHRTNISFPAAALDTGIEGDVKAVLTISEKGSVEQVNILQGDKLLAKEVA